MLQVVGSSPTVRINASVIQSVKVQHYNNPRSSEIVVITIPAMVRMGRRFPNQLMGLR